MNRLRHYWRLFLARFRLSDSAVCEMSRGKGLHDCYHDYEDDEFGGPIHMHVLVCKRCGKEFSI